MLAVFSPTKQESQLSGSIGFDSTRSFSLANANSTGKALADAPATGELVENLTIPEAEELFDWLEINHPSCKRNVEAQPNGLIRVYWHPTN